MTEFKEEVKLGKKIIYWFIGLSIVISVVGFIVNKLGQAAHIDDAVENYEQYQEMYNTCVKLNTDLCNMQSIPETDKMFEQISKSQRILAIKTNLNRWIEEYNAKSKMIGRSLWKSSALPYQLDGEDFSCNN